MNWAGMSVAFGLVTLACLTMPWGILILLALAWVVSRG